MRNFFELLYLRWLLFTAPKERIEQICDYIVNVLRRGQTYHDFNKKIDELEERIINQKREELNSKIKRLND